MDSYEIYLKYISYIMPIVEIFVTGYFLGYFVKPFIKNKKNAIYIGTVYSVTMLIFYIMPLYLNEFIAYGMGVFAAFFVMCLLDKRNYKQKAFISVTFFSLHWFAFAMADILYDELYNFLSSTNYMKVHPDKWFVLYIVMCIFYPVSELLFLAISIKCILKSYIYKHIEISKKELLILTVPSVIGVLGYNIMDYYRNFYIRESEKLSDIYDILAVLYYASSAISIIVVIVLYQNLRTKQEEKLQAKLLASQIDSIKQHIQQAENLYKNIHSIKHDMTNHIITLEKLYTKNRVSEAKAYSMELKKTLGEVTGKINSGNPVTDIILQEIQNKAKEQEIDFNIDFHYPTGYNINAFDISIILFNALQNALENTDKGEASSISILSYRRNNAYMIEISNSFTKNLEWDEQKELLVTSKKNSDGHGYGLLNIRKVAEKYFGDIDIALTDGKFCLSIMLMLEK